MRLNREHFHAIIFYNIRRGLTQQQCMDELSPVFGDEAPSRASVYRWYSEFTRGRSSLEEEFRGGRPKSVVVPETVDTVHKQILQERHVTYREIGTTLGISGTNIHSILHEHLIVKKLFLKNLSIPQKGTRVDCSKEMLKKYDRGASKHVYSIETDDGSWICAYEPGRKQQSTVWYFKMSQIHQKLSGHQALPSN